MVHLLLSAALAPLLVSADAQLGVGTQLTYQGTVAAASGDPAKGKKSFDLTLWVTGQGPSGTDVFWLVDEQGNGQFPWPARFGRLALDARLRSAVDGPALLYDRGEGKSVVPLLLPLYVAAEPLAAGQEFAEDDLQFLVDKADKAAGRLVWRLSVRNRFGPKRSLVVDQAGPLVVAMQEKVIMGRGEEYRLTLQLVGSEQLDKDALAKLTASIDQLAALRDKLNLPARSQQIDWKEEQLEALAAGLPALVEAAAGTALSGVVQAARRDVELQSGRNDALADMRGRFEGQPVAEFSARGLAGEGLTAADLKGQVTVLHFWDYRHEPLQEPYGQVGYLDFLYHRRRADGVRLYGVAVNPRLNDETTRGSAERSAKKLKSFMNLSYPLLLDGGSLLKQFGDPRIVGGSLPLFVVIGPDAKIIHYHVGHYDVDQDQGLKELDDVVQGALGSK